MIFPDRFVHHVLQFVNRAQKAECWMYGYKQQDHGVCECSPWTLQVRVSTLTVVWELAAAVCCDNHPLSEGFVSEP